jgi:hypothetical protein
VVSTFKQILFKYKLTIYQHRTHLKLAGNKHPFFWFSSSQHYREMLNDFDWRPNKMAAQPNNILILAQPNILILKCDMCYYSASCQTYLDEHTKLEHPAMKKYQCDQCDKSFGRKYHLKTHNNLVHLKLKDYGCEECSNNFATNQSLRRHITRVHLKREDFQCDECDEAFGRKSKLMDHIQGEHSNFERYFSIKKLFL